MNFNQNIQTHPFSQPLPLVQSQQPAKNSTLLEFKQISQLESTHQKQMQSNKFQTLVEQTSALIFILQEEKISYINPSAESIPDYLRSQLIQQLTEDDNFGEQLKFQKGKSANSVNYSQEVNIVSKNGREYYLDCNLTTTDFNGKPSIMITAFDVTKYKQATVEIQQAFKAEQEQSKSKARFVSMVSHEFRTPLNTISFSTSLLKRYLQQWTEKKQLKYLDRLQTATEQLSHLMDEVLIIGKAEAGKLKLDHQPLNLGSFCRQLLTEIDLSQTVRPNINFVNLVTYHSVLLDKNLLKIVLTNLLGNAIKYSLTNSKIEFVVFCQGDRLIFQVTDRGMGIPLAEQPKIFEPFHRCSNVTDLPGNGLGLAIAKKLVVLQGGEITLESELGVGSTFIVTLPLSLTNAQASPVVSRQ
jgi:PAS domain S-box-containing protein